MNLLPPVPSSQLNTKLRVGEETRVVFYFTWLCWQALQIFCWCALGRTVKAEGKIRSGAEQCGWTFTSQQTQRLQWGQSLGCRRDVTSVNHYTLCTLAQQTQQKMARWTFGKWKKVCDSDGEMLQRYIFQHYFLSNKYGRLSFAWYNHKHNFYKASFLIY